MRPYDAIVTSGLRVNSMASSQIPYATEQGISKRVSGNLDCTPGGEQGLGCWIDSLVGVLSLEFDRAPVSERGVEPALVVDLVDEAWKRMDDVGECLVAAEIHLFGLERLHEALGLSVVIGDTAPPHGAAQAMVAKHLPVLFCGILRPSVRVMDAAGWRSAVHDR